MKAVILVGGQGTRMRPLTLKTPKPLLPIANVAFIERQVRWLAKYGVTEVILSMGYMPDEFETYFKSNPIPGVFIDFAVEKDALGTAGAIKFAAGSIEEDILVCNGDVYTNLEISELLEFHNSRNSIATIALTYVEDPSAFGVVPTHADGEVIAFVEKPPIETAPSHWINAGIYVLTPEFLELIPDGVNCSIEREVFPRALEASSMYALESDSYWLDIGTPLQYLRAHSDFLDSIEERLDGEHLQEIKPGLFSDGDVEIGEGVIVKSNSIVGAGSIIGDRCILTGCTLGGRCIVENDVEISNSVIFSGSRLGSGSFLDSSVIGNSCDLGENVQIRDQSLVGDHEKINPGTNLYGERLSTVV